MYKKFFPFLALLFAGCASNPMVVAPQQELAAPAGDKAQVVFMRSSLVIGAVGASLYSVADGNIEYIGTINNGTKVAYTADPGKHVFMVVAGPGAYAKTADFMEADLGAGKNYFSIVTPVWPSRFSLWPIKKDAGAKFNLGMPEFDRWVKKTKLVKNSEKSKAWYEKNKESVRHSYEASWPVWETKSERDLFKRTLSREDGI